MRTKIDWLFLTRLNSNVELEFFMKQFPKATSAHGNLNKCSICPDNIDGHKMRVLYPYCSCSTECSTRYLINKCLSSSQVVVKGINLHAPSQTIESQENIIEKKGISEKFKEAIEKIIYRNITKPYSIYQMLLLDYGDDTTIPKLTQINKNAIKIPKIFQESIVNDIIHLRCTKIQSSFEFKKKRMLNKWKRMPYIKTFLNYFTKQWIDSPFSIWQLFQTPPGYSMTNCPLESYNGKIKNFFTNRMKYNLLPVFELFEKVVKLESRVALTLQIPESAIAKITVKKEAKKYLDSIKSLGENDGILKYLCHDKHKVQINPECFCTDCTKCTCSKFLDAAVCMHLVGCCFLDSIDFPGIRTKKFVNKSTSKKRKAGPWYEKD